MRATGLASVVAICAVWIGSLLIGDDVHVPRVRRCADRELSATMADVLSRLPADEAAAARVADGCPITHVHEGTHFLNSRLSTARTRGFYLLDGFAWTLPIPANTKLLHVAEAVPKKYRGKTYTTYLVDAQKWWQDVAIYPLDEAVAYWHGAIVRREHGMVQRQETERFGVELLVYSKYAIEEIARRDPDYPIAELRDLFELLVARARMICREFDKQPYAEALGDAGMDLIARIDDEEQAVDAQASQE